jgi:hypothetical protein
MVPWWGVFAVQLYGYQMLGRSGIWPSSVFHFANSTFCQILEIDTAISLFCQVHFLPNCEPFSSLATPLLTNWVPNWKVRICPNSISSQFWQLHLVLPNFETFSSLATPLLTNWVPNWKVHICPIQFSQVNFVIGPAFPSCQLHIAILRKIHETSR